MSWIASDKATAVTVRAIEVVLLRPCASATVIGRLFAPGVVLTATTVEKENVPSPAVGSPLLPSSKNTWFAAPPIALKFPVTVIPVLVGLVPGVTTTRSNVVPPCATDEGVALPTPVGFVLAT